MNKITIICALMCALVLTASCTSDVGMTNTTGSEKNSHSEGNSKMSEPEFEIINERSMIQVKSASAKPKQHGTLLSLKVTRKNYTLLPTGAHIDVAVFDSNGNSLESISIDISGQQFRRSITGRYRPDYVHREMDIEFSEISRVRITSYSRKHQNHEA